MRSDESNQKLTVGQQRILKLLFKFRFVSAGLLAMVMGIRREGVYQVLEQLVSKGLVTKVYKEEWRIDRKPAYYYLNKSGVQLLAELWMSPQWYKTDGTVRKDGFFISTPDIWSEEWLSYATIYT